MQITDTDRGRERLERVLRSRRADGLMLLALHGEDPLYQLAQRLELPVVLGGCPLHGQPPAYVDADNRGGARVATEHLISSGRRRIAAITGRQDTHLTTCPIARSTDPALTTVHQPVQALGQEMAKMLIDLMADEQPSPLLLPTHLVVRASAP